MDQQKPYINYVIRRLFRNFVRLKCYETSESILFSAPYRNSIDFFLRFSWKENK